MLATIVYAINPRQDTPVEGFTAFSPTPENALKRKRALEQQIKGDGYKHWYDSKWRMAFIDRCKANAWEIRVETVMIS